MFYPYEDGRTIETVVFQAGCRSRMASYDKQKREVGFISVQRERDPYYKPL
jgi:hypothetical protein